MFVPAPDASPPGKVRLLVFLVVTLFGEYRTWFLFFHVGGGGAFSSFAFLSFARRKDNIARWSVILIPNY